MEDHAHHMPAMVHGLDYGLAFITGFLGSGHCFGMCGALVSGFFMRAGQSKGYLPYFSYHMARISIYALVGTAAAMLGYVLVSTGMTGKIQGILQIAIGSFVIILALGILGIIPWQGSFRLLPLGMLRKGFATAATKGSAMGAALGGVLNGLMPCPLTFAMAVQATSAATPWQGGLLMLAFGAGTFPTMLVVSLAFGKIGVRLRGIMLKSAAVVMILMGLNTFYKGISFFTEENFNHRHFFNFLQGWVEKSVVFLSEFVDYLTELIKILHQ